VDKNLSAFFLTAWSGILAYHVTRTKGTHSVGSALGKHWMHGGAGDGAVWDASAHLSLSWAGFAGNLNWKIKLRGVRNDDEARPPLFISRVLQDPVAMERIWPCQSVLPLDPSIDLDGLFDRKCNYAYLPAWLADAYFALPGCGFAILILGIFMILLGPA